MPLEVLSIIFYYRLLPIIKIIGLRFPIPNQQQNTPKFPKEKLPMVPSALRWQGSGIPQRASLWSAHCGMPEPCPREAMHSLLRLHAYGSCHFCRKRQKRHEPPTMAAKPPCPHPPPLKGRCVLLVRPFHPEKYYRWFPPHCGGKGQAFRKEPPFGRHIAECLTLAPERPCTSCCASTPTAHATFCVNAKRGIRLPPWRHSRHAPTHRP